MEVYIQFQKLYHMKNPCRFLYICMKFYKNIDELKKSNRYRMFKMLKNYTYKILNTT